MTLFLSRLGEKQMKVIKGKVEILLALVIALAISCNGLPFASKKDNTSSNTAIAGLAALASSSQASSSSNRLLVMPECGKGVFTGETVADLAKNTTLIFNSIWGG
jgi:hypothetical protein